jgi:hypothetical protein
MDRTVARLNIEYLKKKLAMETDDAKQQTILRLIAEEEAKVAALGTAPKARKSRS